MSSIDNLLGSTRRVVEVEEPLNNCRGVTYRVVNVDGGGGSSTKVVSKTDSMPEASASNADMVYLFDGESDATYTHGYIYENVATTTSSSASATQSVGSGLSDIAVDLETLESFTGWTTDNSLQIFYTDDGWSVDTTSLGVTYTGTPSVGDAITISYTAPVTTYAWVRLDVQPAPEALPDQSGQSGKFLTTDGTDASWETINALQNTATGTNALTILGTASSRSSTVNIGVGSKTLSDYAVAIGRGATTSVGCVAIGNVSVASNYSTAIGCSSNISYMYNHGVAIGYNTAIGANYAIQLGTDATREAGGYSTTNSDANTFKVANENGNFELMSANGTIPAARHASLPAADGTYVLKLTISGGVPTLAWVAE